MYPNQVLSKKLKYEVRGLAKMAPLGFVIRNVTYGKSSQHECNRYLCKLKKALSKVVAMLQ